MPDPKDNLDPKEATEARLCAYLEGELTTSERTEIEKHLGANPQHRQLLADLAKTRSWMRLIPNEMAPSDLSEVFQQQVERSMLLDDSTAGSRSAMNRWPQVALMAAMVLLVAGLSVVIVAMLRPPKAGNAISFAKSPMPAATQLTVTEDRAARKKEPEVPAFAADVAATPASPAGVAGAGDHVAASESPVESGLVASMNKALPPRREPADMFSTQAVKTKLLSSGYYLPADQKTVCFVVSTESTDNTANQVRGFFGRHELVFDNGLADKNTIVTQTINRSIPNTPIAIGAAKAIATTLPTSAPSEMIYVAHGLTPLQLELLSASLASDNLNQTVKRITLAEPPTTAPVTSLAGAITKGQTLNVTIPQLVGPGIEKTNVAKVAEDGTINLPMIDPLPAAGALPGELEQRIALKYREANLIPQATVTVQMPGSAQPTSMPATQPLINMPMPTQPTTSPIVLAAPTTQILHQETGINVVVLIENAKP